jgi:hypothetical protein
VEKEGTAQRFPPRISSRLEAGAERRAEVAQACKAAGLYGMGNEEKDVEKNPKSAWRPRDPLLLVTDWLGLATFTVVSPNIFAVGSQTRREVARTVREVITNEGRYR